MREDARATGTRGRLNGDRKGRPNAGGIECRSQPPTVPSKSIHHHKNPLEEVIAAQKSYGTFAPNTWVLLMSTIAQGNLPIVVTGK